MIPLKGADFTAKAGRASWSAPWCRPAEPSSQTCFSDHQAAAAEAGWAEEDAPEGAGEWLFTCEPSLVACTNSWVWIHPLVLSRSWNLIQTLKERRDFQKAEQTSRRRFVRTPHQHAVLHPPPSWWPTRWTWTTHERSTLSTSNMLSLSLCPPERRRSVPRAAASERACSVSSWCGPACVPLLGLPADPGCVCAAQLHPGGRGHAEANSGV